MATGKRTEMVRSVGFKFGNFVRFALLQSRYCVESAFDQKANSSSSVRNSGIRFFMLRICFTLPAIHVSSGNDSDQLSPDGEYHEQSPADRRFPKRLEPRFLQRMRVITHQRQRIVKENRLRLLRTHAMLVPILRRVGLVPVKSDARFKRIQSTAFHVLYISQIYD